jgi:2'-5' RNA ligase
MAGSPARGGSSHAPAATPAPIEGALSAHGMNMGGNFTPGRPLQPYFGYSTPARAQDYPVGVNIATQGRAAWGKVSFDVIKALIDAYDVARMCVNHKIDELRSMELLFQPAHGVEDDVEDAIDAARLVLDKPDRELPYESWISKWLENAFKYDAAPLYKRRDYNGDIVGIEVVDGRTIAPYIDDNGRRPKPPAPAYWQVIHGMVGTWFTTDDLIYTPFRPQEDSPYGLAPIESVVITANTDIRAQWHFLQWFTDGSVPAGFMELPPDVSEPGQVREWQDHWDALVMGDQAKLHQLLAVPNGSKFTGTKPAAFDAEFPRHLMMRTCAAFGVVPQDLGLIQDVNRANGETQVDIQFRVNTLPWVRWVEGTLTRYLQHDIGLPVKVSLDTGRDKEDRLAEARAHQIYVEMGAESPDEVRVDILGKKTDKERPTPRFFSTPRLGPVTLLAIEGAAGKTDPETFGPAKGQLILDQPYVPPISVVPTPGTTDDKASLAAVDAYQVQARRALEGQQDPHRETEAQREARGAAQQRPATGDAPLKAAPQGSQDQQCATGAQQQEEPVAKGADLTGAEAAELSAFREFVTGSRRRGKWRDFVFKTVSPLIAAELNRGGRAEVAAIVKASNTPGLTKRSGMISLDLPGVIPAVPDGVDDHHITLVYLGSDVDDDAFAEACRRAQDAAALAPGPLSGSVGGLGAFAPSDGSDGKIPVWAAVDVPGIESMHGALRDLSKSGRDGYHPHVTLAYLDFGDRMPDPVPDTAVRFTHVSVHRGDQVVRYPLGDQVAKADRADVLGWEGAVGPSPSEYTKPHVYARDTGSGAGNCVCGMDPRAAIHIQLAPGVDNPDADPVAKADDGSPKAPARSDETWPGWQFDLAAAAYWAPRIGAALIAAVDVEQIARGWLAGQHDHDTQRTKERRDALIATAVGWLATYRAQLAAALRPFVAELYTDGYAIGTAAARSLVSHTPVDVGDWEPGEIRAAEQIILREGDGAGLRALFEAAQVSIGLMADSRTTAMARALADAVLEQRTTSELGDALRMVLADPGRTGRLALAELTRASGAAASAVYQRSRIATHRWLTAEDNRVCPICDENAAAGSIPLGTPFPSGDLWPPAHPGGCRCATVPG